MTAPLSKHNFIVYCSIVILCSPVAPLASLADGEDASSYGSLDTASARSYVENLRESLHLPGLAVAVEIHGEMVWSHGFGFADIDNRIPVTPETIFRIGSVSKVLTAGGVARLYEQGRLNLDDDVRTYVPEFPEKTYVVTTRQLVSHLSGIRHYGYDEERPEKQYESVVEALELFKDDPLLFEPGTSTSYSSYGWVLVSAIMERAADVAFDKFMIDEVFQATGMGETRPAGADHGSSTVSLLYDDGDAVVADNLSSVLSAGGYSSTVIDLVRYGSAVLADSDFLSPDTREWMFQPQKTRDGEEGRYGVGWIIDELDDGTPIYHHGGTVIGGHSVLLLNPADGIVVAMLANSSSSFGANEANQVVCQLLGLERCPTVSGETTQMLMIMGLVQDLQSVLDGWKVAVESGDFGSLTEMISDGFVSTTWGSASDVQNMLREDIANRIMDIEDAHLRLATFHIGSIARVEDIEVRTGSQVEHWLLKFVLTTQGWQLAAWERQ